MDRSLLWRAALVQLLAVAALSLLLGLALPHSFFEDWGILAGPGAWIACAAFTARVLHLPIARTLAIAAGAGVVGALAGLGIGHDAGIVVAIALFALGCGAILPR